MKQTRQVRSTVRKRKARKHRKKRGPCRPDPTWTRRRLIGEVDIYGWCSLPVYPPDDFYVDELKEERDNDE